MEQICLNGNFFSARASAERNISLEGVFYRGRLEVSSIDTESFECEFVTKKQQVIHSLKDGLFVFDEPVLSMYVLNEAVLNDHLLQTIAHLVLDLEHFELFPQITIPTLSADVLVSEGAVVKKQLSLALTL